MAVLNSIAVRDATTAIIVKESGTDIINTKPIITRMKKVVGINDL
jgi:hypothetical protein